MALSAPARRSRTPTVRDPVSWTLAVFAAGLFGLLLPAETASADDEPVAGKPADAPLKNFEPTYFQGTRVGIDGEFHDWRGPATVRTETLTAGEHEYDWTGPADLSAEVQLQHNDTSLFVHVRVWDNAFKAPNKKTRHGGDSIDLWFDLGQRVDKRTRFRQLRIDPTWAIGDQALEIEFRHPRKLRRRDTDAVDATAVILEDGYELEAEIPFETFAPAPPIFRPLGFCVVVNDWDHDDKLEEQASVSTCPFDFTSRRRHRAEDMGQVSFETRENVWRGIKRQIAAAEDGPSHTVFGNVGGDARQEEIAVVEDQLLVLGLGLGPGEWFALDLGLWQRDTVTGLRLEDVTRDDTHEIVVTVTRTGTVGDVDVEQEIVSLYDFVDEKGISDALVSVETVNRRADGSAAVTNSLDFRSRKIVQKDAEANAWDEESYLDADGGFPEGYHPLLLPWERPRSRTYRANDEGVFEP